VPIKYKKSHNKSKLNKTTKFNHQTTQYRMTKLKTNKKNEKKTRSTQPNFGWKNWKKKLKR
jgi:hypothetical protein